MEGGSKTYGQNMDFELNVWFRCKMRLALGINMKVPDWHGSGRHLEKVRQNQSTSLSEEEIKLDIGPKRKGFLDCCLGQKLLPG